MISVYPAASRYSVDLGWLRSRPHFSFGEYYDADRTGYGVMRVCNDDYVAPGRGFGAHPHSDMEIVSIVLAGKIRHEDSLGNNVVSSFGEVQRMSAGSGVIHTEFNASAEEELRLLQLWFMPKERGTAPSYEAVRFDPAKLANSLLPVVAEHGSGETASINQDMAIYLSRLEPGKTVVHDTGSDRKLLVYVIEGAVSCEGQRLGEGDIAHIGAVARLELAAVAGETFFMLVDMPQEGL